MILIVDNFDSFTYNLVDYFYQLGEECEVIRNDIHPSSLDFGKYSAVVLSPGPGKPEEAGFLLDYIEALYNRLPLLGICLGHQALASFFGGKVVKGSKPMHGKISEVKVEVPMDDLFQGLKEQFRVVRYHSLVVDLENASNLISLAKTLDQENMILKHTVFPIYGIQYHPEAALTDFGLQILSNWNKIVGRKNKALVDKLP